jgi:hypothetical protein
VVQLADSNAPRAGSYTRADARVELSRQTPGGSRWELTASLMARTSPAVPEANTQQSELALEYSHPFGQWGEQWGGQTGSQRGSQWGGYLGTTLVNIITDGGTHYASQGLVMGLQAYQHRSCSARAGLEWQNRDLSSNPILSSSYSGLAAQWACSAAGGGQWQLSAKAGRDRPQDPERPGGDQTVASVRGVVLWPLSALPLGGLQMAGNVLVEAELTTSQDTTGYSPLLDHAAIRSNRRTTARLEYQRTLGARLLGKTLQGTLGAEWSTQDSSLALFRVQSWGPYAALRLQW